MLPDNLLKIINSVNFHSLHNRSCFLWIRIKRGNNLKTLTGKSLVPQESTAQITDPDNHDPPLDVGPQNMPDRLD